MTGVLFVTKKKYETTTEKLNKMPGRNNSLCDAFFLILRDAKEIKNNEEKKEEDCRCVARVDTSHRTEITCSVGETGKTRMGKRNKKKQK